MLIQSQCVVANIDADDQKNKGIAGRYEVKGYPTLKFFPAGSKEPVDYNGGRTTAEFVKYLNEQCGTNRAVEGGLNDDVRYTAVLTIKSIDNTRRLAVYLNLIR